MGVVDVSLGMDDELHIFSFNAAFTRNSVRMWKTDLTLSITSSFSRCSSRLRYNHKRYNLINTFFLASIHSQTGKNSNEYSAGDQGPRYTNPGLQAEKKIRAHHKYKKNIAVTDCLQAGYSITRQPVIAIFFFFFYFCYARFFPTCSLGLVYLRPK